MRHPLSFILGSLFFVLGSIGLILPLLPTTPFYLASVGCFMKSSPSFASSILKHPICGSIISDYQHHRCVRPHIKKKAILVLWISILTSIIMAPLIMVKIGLVFIGLGCTFMIQKLNENPQTFTSK